MALPSFPAGASSGPNHRWSFFFPDTVYAVQYRFHQYRWIPFRETPLQRPLCRKTHRAQNSCYFQTNGTETIYTTGTSLTGVKGILWKWVKLLLFLCQHGTNVIFLSTDLVGQILSAFFLEQSIQLFHRLHFGNRDAGVPSTVTYRPSTRPFSFSGCRVAENGFESIVGRQSSIPGLFPGMSAETILNSNFSIVEDDSPGDTAEVLEYLDQGIQKAFFILPSVCQKPTVHRCNRAGRRISSPLSLLRTDIPVASPQSICIASPGGKDSGTNASWGFSRSWLTRRRTVVSPPVNPSSSTSRS